MQVATLLTALFLRGEGLGATRRPAVSAAYVSVEQRDLPMATTLNIVQRLGGLTLTTRCALMLAQLLGAPLPRVGMNA